MKSTISMIRDHIAELPDDTIFATRDFLDYGSRNAVDLAIFRLVTIMEIRRLARGLFMKFKSNMKLPDISVIAEAKARAFGKKIKEHGVKVAIRIGLLEEKYLRTKINRFITSGCSSSFQSIRGRIFFFSTSARKFDLSSTGSDNLVKACWAIGRSRTYTLLSIARYIKSNLEKAEQLDLRKNKRRMPDWLLKFFYSSRRRRKPPQEPWNFNFGLDPQGVRLIGSPRTERGHC